MNNQTARTVLMGFLLVLLCGAGVWLGALVLDGKPPSGEKKTEQAPLPADHNASPVPAEIRAAEQPAEEKKPLPPVASGDAGSIDIISEILSNTDLDFPSAVNRLLEALPRLDETGQEEAAHHIANLSDDARISHWSAMLVANQLPAPAADVLFNDLLNRPQEVNMPVLSAIADQRVHPKNKETVEILETLYGAPPAGTTWAAWTKAALEKER